MAIDLEEMKVLAGEPGQLQEALADEEPETGYEVRFYNNDLPKAPPKLVKYIPLPEPEDDPSSAQMMQIVKLLHKYSKVSIVGLGVARMAKGTRKLKSA